MLETSHAGHAAPAGESGLTIAVRPDNGRVAVMLSGDLDLGTADELRQEIDSLREAGFDDIALDLAGVRFLDSTGLQTLLSYTRTARDGELRFGLTRPSAPVQRLFELTATRHVFEFVDRPAT